MRPHSSPATPDFPDPTATSVEARSTVGDDGRQQASSAITWSSVIVAPPHILSNQLLSQLREGRCRCTRAVVGAMPSWWAVRRCPGRGAPGTPPPRAGGRAEHVAGAGGQRRAAQVSNSPPGREGVRARRQRRHHERCALIAVRTTHASGAGWSRTFSQRSHAPRTPRQRPPPRRPHTDRGKRCLKAPAACPGVEAGESSSPRSSAGLRVGNSLRILGPLPPQRAAARRRLPIVEGRLRLRGGPPVTGQTRIQRASSSRSAWHRCRMACPLTSMSRPSRHWRR
jgi:hypothetical protein